MKEASPLQYTIYLQNRCILLLCSHTHSFFILRKSLYEGIGISLKKFTDAPLQVQSIARKKIDFGSNPPDAIKELSWTGRGQVFVALSATLLQSLPAFLSNHPKIRYYQKFDKAVCRSFCKNVLEMISTQGVGEVVAASVVEEVSPSLEKEPPQQTPTFQKVGVGVEVAAAQEQNQAQKSEAVADRDVVEHLPPSMNVGQADHPLPQEQQADHLQQQQEQDDALKNKDNQEWRLDKSEYKSLFCFGLLVVMVLVISMADWYKVYVVLQGFALSTGSYFSGPATHLFVATILFGSLISGIVSALLEVEDDIKKWLSSISYACIACELSLVAFFVLMPITKSDTVLLTTNANLPNFLSTLLFYVESLSITAVMGVIPSLGKFGVIKVLSRHKWGFHQKDKSYGSH